ncbi:MAG: uracil phosphoribosyltransferase [Halobacteriovoraceae bacterium]|nr:uracil phosphoribosyltransferase [Halobacteriovoraceae bacterium]
MTDLTKEDVEYLLTPQAIRDTTAAVYKNALEGGTHFKVHENKLNDCADFVLDVIYKNYPSLKIPFHSRWGHFQVGGVDRIKLFDDKVAQCDSLEKARRKIELAITSVLLDAGAGPEWSYKEIDKVYNRSEGLAVASFHLFLEGSFSEKNECLADAKGLQAFSKETLEKGFQVDENNPLVGVQGRVALIQKLGETVKDNKYFPGDRPGGMIDYLIAHKGDQFKVQDILEVVLKGLGSIWPGRIQSHGVNLGDVWHYSSFGDFSAQSVVCFHKLSQWLTYSLVGPIEEAGLSVSGAEELTGLAEYRNGGLFLDFGVIELKDPSLLNQSHLPQSDLIIEWRALTIQLLDRIGQLVQNRLQKSPADFPLAKVLEGGTWWAGRKLAKQKRSDSSPPLKLESDGTVF